MKGDIQMLILILPLSVIPFWPALQGNFVFDDSEAVLRNADVRNRSQSLWKVFSNDFWGRSLLSNHSHKSYRPLTILTFRWNYIEDIDAKYFHFLNLLFHSAACVLVWFVFGNILKASPWTSTKTLNRIRVCATILFAVIPVHTENVAGIVGRADVLAAIFFFSAFLLYSHLVFLESSFSFYHFITLVLSLVVALLSMLFKENGITVLGFCLTFDLIKAWPFKNYSKCWRHIFGRILCLLVGSISCLYFRWWIMGGTMPNFQPLDNPAAFVNSTLLRTINYNYIYAINFWILLCPIWLCFDWSMGCIPLIKNCADLRIIAVICFWIILISLFLIIFGFRCSLNFKRQTAYAVSLVVLPFLPASNLFMTVGFVVAERVLYLSSAGFCLLIAVGLELLHRRLKHLINTNWFLVLLVFCNILRSWQRSYDWCTEEKLFQSGALVCPLNAKVYYNIAKNAADSGRSDFAITNYRKALNLYPDYDQALNNLANLLKDNGNIHEAENLLLRAVKMRRDFAAAWMNLGIVQFHLKKHKEAKQSYLTALTYRPKYPDCYYNLGNLFLELNLHELAYDAWKNATLLKPTHAGSWNNMVIMFDNIGELERAKRLGEEAVNVLPNEAFTYFNLANVLGKLGDFANSEINFLKAISINGTIPIYYTNLGVLYHRWRRNADAIKAYKYALHLNPNSHSANENLLKLSSTEQSV